MKQTRVSRRRVENLCRLFDYQLIRFQELGNRKSYWYSYNLYNEKDELLLNHGELKDAHAILIKKCEEFIGIDRSAANDD